MADLNQDQAEPYQLSGDDLSELHGVAQQMQAAGDPRAERVWNFIDAHSSGYGGEAAKGKVYRQPLKVTSWLQDLENTLWGNATNGQSDGSAQADGNTDIALAGANNSAAETSLAENGTESADDQRKAAAEDATSGAAAQDEAQLKPPRTSAGPAESDPTAWEAFMESLDSQKVGNYTVGGLANVLTNESRDLSFVGPSTSIFDNDLDRAKYVQAHAIINNAMLKKPNDMGKPTVTKAAEASPGHTRDIAIMRQAYFDRMTRGGDPAQGRTYFGNSAFELKSRPIGNARQTPFARFGPFRWGTHDPQYIYIFNDPSQEQK